MDSDRARYSHAVACGARVREARKAQGLTQKGLASKAGISFQYLSNVEKGEVNTGIETLAMIADALKVPLGDFITPQGEHSRMGYRGLGYAVALTARSKMQEGIEALDEWIALVH